jgi:hypothetical protein
MPTISSLSVSHMMWSSPTIQVCGILSKGRLFGSPVLTRALSQGNSQSGRYLRDFIYSGFNEDEAHRVVFDGSIPPWRRGGRS